MLFRAGVPNQRATAHHQVAGRCVRVRAQPHLHECRHERRSCLWPHSHEHCHRRSQPPTHEQQGLCACAQSCVYPSHKSVSSFPLPPAPGHQLQKVGELCFRVLALLPNFVWPADLISIPFNLSSKSLVKIIKSRRHRTLLILPSIVMKSNPSNLCGCWHSNRNSLSRKGKSQNPIKTCDWNWMM